MGSKQLEARLKRLEERSEGVSQRAYARRLRELDRHLKEARAQPSPGLALHRSNARTVLFQLECLARAHREIIDEDEFVPLHLAFKALEDGLGAVDFSDGMLKRLGVANVDSELRAYFIGRRAEAAHTIEKQLSMGEWWPEGDEPSEALDEVLDSLEEQRWPSAKKERKLFAEYFSDSAKGLHDKLVKGEFDFNALEDGVHEFRRKVRWLSILPASLDGLFVRLEDAAIEPDLASYCTASVLASPFNSFPRREEVPEPIVLDASSFLAVSWIIAELGALKDRGQLADAVAHAARDLEDGPKAAAARVRKVVGDSVPTHESIGAAVAGVMATFVKDNVLARLAKGTG